jgi:hypothetical protein
MSFFASLNMTILINKAENSRQFVCFVGKLFFSGALAEKLGNIEVNEIGVMKNDRLD